MNLSDGSLGASIDKMQAELLSEFKHFGVGHHGAIFGLRHCIATLEDALWVNCVEACFDAGKAGPLVRKLAFSRSVES